MAWGTIRQATDEDIARYRAAAERFIVRHDIRQWNDSEYNDPTDDVEFHLEDLVSRGQHEESRYLRRLWLRAVRRALRNPSADGIAYGYVGYHAQ
jgi:hypothetical protein